MALIMIATVLTGVVIGLFFGWLSVKNKWTSNVDDLVGHAIATVFACAFIGLVNGIVICGITALVRYFV